MGANGEQIRSPSRNVCYCETISFSRGSSVSRVLNRATEWQEADAWDYSCSWTNLKNEKCPVIVFSVFISLRHSFISISCFFCRWYLLYPSLNTCQSETHLGLLCLYKWGLCLYWSGQCWHRHAVQSGSVGGLESRHCLALMMIFRRLLEWNCKCVEEQDGEWTRTWHDSIDTLDIECA